MPLSQPVHVAGTCTNECRQGCVEPRSGSPMSNPGSLRLVMTLISITSDERAATIERRGSVLECGDLSPLCGGADLSAWRGNESGCVARFERGRLRLEQASYRRQASMAESGDKSPHSKVLRTPAHELPPQNLTATQHHHGLRAPSRKSGQPDNPCLHPGPRRSAHSPLPSRRWTMDPLLTEDLRSGLSGPPVPPPQLQVRCSMVALMMH